MPEEPGRAALSCCTVGRTRGLESSVSPDVFGGVPIASPAKCIFGK